MNNANEIKKEVLEESLKNIELQIKDLVDLQSNMEDISTKFKIQLDSLTIQHQKLVEQVNEFKNNQVVQDDGFLLNKVNEKYDSNSEKENDLENEIQLLKAQRETLKTTSIKKVVDSRIAKKQAKLEILKAKEVKLGSRQRIMVIAKQKKTNKKNELLSTQEAKVSMTQDQINDLENLKGTLDIENSLGDKITSKIYDIKGKFYEKKLDHQEQVFSTLKDNNVGFKGANVMVVSKKATNSMRSNMSKLSSKIKSGLIKGINAAQSKLEELNSMLQEESPKQEVRETFLSI